MVDSTDPNATIPAIGMVTVKGLVTDYDSVAKEADLDIVLVVDLSGSMAGVPIATMKNVILHLIDTLKENHRLGELSGINKLDTQPETRKLQQVCYHQAHIRMRSHRLLRLDDNKLLTDLLQVANCMQA